MIAADDSLTARPELVVMAADAGLADPSAILSPEACEADAELSAAVESFTITAPVTTPDDVSTIDSARATRTPKVSMFSCAEAEADPFTL